LKRDGHFDDAFIAAHTTGLEEITAFIDNSTPQWGEEKTGVPANLIEQAAGIYATGPSLLWVGQGL